MVVVAWENTSGSKVDDSPHYATVYPFNNTNKISKNNYYPSIEVMEKM